MVSNSRDFALSHLDRLQSFFPRVDSKATYLFAINVGMAGILAANLPLPLMVSIHAIPAWVALAWLAWSTAAIFRSLFPSLEGTGVAGLIYFGDAAALPMEDFVGRFKNCTDSEMEEDAIRQAWRNAEILKIKFDHVHQAFRATSFALPFWLLFLCLVASQGGLPTFNIG